LTDNWLDDVAALCALLREWPSAEMSTDRYALAVGPFVTFYFKYPPARYVEASLLLVDLHEEFAALIGHPYVSG
jgi:hypothetical protein